MAVCVCICVCVCYPIMLLVLLVYFNNLFSLALISLTIKYVHEHAALFNLFLYFVLFCFFLVLGCTV